MSESIREKVKLTNTLACLLQALQGQVTTIELRNESSVKGHIVDVDCYMNTHMSDVEFINPKGQVTPLSTFFVQGKNIRFVQIPSHVNIINAMEKQLRLIEGKNAYKHSRKPKMLRGKRAADLTEVSSRPEVSSKPEASS